MPRPCENDHPPQYAEGDVFDRSDGKCRSCWLYANNEEYRQAWDHYGGKLPDVTSPKTPHRDSSKPRMTIEQLSRLKRH